MGHHCAAAFFNHTFSFVGSWHYHKNQFTVVPSLPNCISAQQSLSASKDKPFQSCIAIGNLIKQLHGMKQRTASLSFTYLQYSTFFRHKLHDMVSIFKTLFYTPAFLFTSCCQFLHNGLSSGAHFLPSSENLLTNGKSLLTGFRANCNIIL